MNTFHQRQSAIDFSSITGQLPTTLKKSHQTIERLHRSIEEIKKFIRQAREYLADARGDLD